MKIKNKSNEMRGFSLTELMVGMAILGLVTIGLTAFVYDSTKGMYWAANKSLITRDVRNFTVRLSQETLGARAAFVYDSFALADRDENEDQRQDGETGDCLVLVYYDPYPAIKDPYHYTKIVVFYRKPENDSLSPVYRAAIEFDTPQVIDTDSGFDHFEDFLASCFADDQGDHPIVLELSRGLADGRLFRNFGNATYIVNGEILHGNKNQEVTNTYNLTISPRG